jgi:hypothetical protein
MTKGKSKERLGKRNGTQSNASSRASASDRQHDERQVVERKSIKAGTEQGGKMKERQGGGKK